MSRRCLALLLALFLLLPGFNALAEEEARALSVSRLNGLMEEFLNTQGYTYTFEDDTYFLDFPLDSALSSCKVEVRVYYDALEVIATPLISAAEANREKLALFITLANYQLFYSQLGMQLESGKFYSRSVQLVEDVYPGMEELGVLLHLCLIDLDHYGDALSQVALMGADPYKTFASTME